MRSSFCARADKMITGTRVGLSWSALQISKPSAPCGSIRSSRRRSGVNRLTVASASWPLSHVSTTNHSYSRLWRSSLAIALSSSMMRMRLVICRSRLAHSCDSTAAERQRHVDFGSQSNGAAHLDPAAMALDDAFGDRQAEAAAAARDVAAAIEALEDPREVLAGDPRSAIPDRQCDVPVAGGALDR